MAENIRGVSPCRIRGFLLLCLFVTTVAKRYRKYQFAEGKKYRVLSCGDFSLYSQPLSSRVGEK